MIEFQEIEQNKSKYFNNKSIISRKDEETNLCHTRSMTKSKDISRKIVLRKGRRKTRRNRCKGISDFDSYLKKTTKIYMYKVLFQIRISYVI